MMFLTEAKKRVQEFINSLILDGEEVCLKVKEANFLKNECIETGKRVGRLSQLLKTLLCFIFSAQSSLYLRPVTCIVSEVSSNFKFAQEIVSQCKHHRLLSRLFNYCNVTHFRQLFHLLDTSIRNMEWLVTVYDPHSGAIGPTANMSPTSLVWSCIATVQMGRHLGDRIQAAKCLELLAEENDEYKKIIFEEGGVPPLLTLLKQNSLEDQITAANALCRLANEQERTKIIMKEMVSIIVNRLSRKSPMRDQIQAADLVASIANLNPKVKEYHLIRENVIWRLVTLLSSEPFADDSRMNLCDLLKLKISCSNALWELARGSVPNCRTLTETKGMLCLAKLVGTEKDQLQYNCLMIIKEITSLAESNENFRHSAFKSTSKAAKAVVDQLLEIIKEFDDSKLKIPAIKSIGSLARSFSAKDIQVVKCLVPPVDNVDQEVALEAAMALQKFLCPGNLKNLEHSKSLIEFDGVPRILKLLDGDIKSQRQGLALICCLAKNGDNRKALIKAGVLTALEKTSGLVATEYPELQNWLLEATSELQLSHADTPEESDITLEGNIQQAIMEQSSNRKALIKAGVLTALEKTSGLVTKEYPELQNWVLEAKPELQLNPMDTPEESDRILEVNIHQATMEESKSESSIEGRIKQDIMEQSIVAYINSQLPNSKVLPERFTGFPQKLVENLKSNYRSWSGSKRCRRRFLSTLPSFNTRRCKESFLRVLPSSNTRMILPLVKDKCLDLVLNCQGRWPKMENIATLRLLNYIVNPFN